eukprot:222355-Pelagomonas_calceolata.AAC.1
MVLLFAYTTRPIQHAPVHEAEHLWQEHVQRVVDLDRGFWKGDKLPSGSMGGKGGVPGGGREGVRDVDSAGASSSAGKAFLGAGESGG